MWACVCAFYIVSFSSQVVPVSLLAPFSLLVVMASVTVTGRLEPAHAGRTWPAITVTSVLPTTGTTVRTKAVSPVVATHNTPWEITATLWGSMKASESLKMFHAKVNRIKVYISILLISYFYLISLSVCPCVFFQSVSVSSTVHRPVPMSFRLWG